MTDVGPEVIKIITKKIRVEKANVGMDDRLQDLGLESLDALELVFDLEEKFDIEIPVNANDPQIGGFATVADVVHAIEKLVAKKS
jgi:acyl carrier protein